MRLPIKISLILNKCNVHHLFVYPYYEQALWVSLSGSCGQDTGDTKDPGSPGREEHNCFHNQMSRKKKT